MYICTYICTYITGKTLPLKVFVKQPLLCSYSYLTVSTRAKAR